MRTRFLAALLLALSVQHQAAAISISGGISCSGDLNIPLADFGHLACNGDLSLTDAVISDPLKIVLEASGVLTIQHVRIEAPVIEFMAPVIVADGLIELDSTDIRIVAGGIEEGAGTPLPSPPALPDTGGLLFVRDDSSTHGATLTLGERHVPGIALPWQGGTIRFANGASLGTMQPEAAAPPVIVAGNVPEPSAALLLAIGLGVIVLQRSTTPGAR
jgi:hypothetical protein